MEAGRKHLGEAELEVMLVVWGQECPVSASRVLEGLAGRRSWGLPTLMTVLSRLCAKGFLICEKNGRSNFYTPLVEEADYQEQEGRSLLERLYGNSLPSLVASLHRGGAVGEEELAELRRFLDEAGKGEGK